MNNYSHNQIFIQNTYCSFLESKKNEKPFLLSFCFLCCMKQKEFVESEMHLSAVALKLLTNLSVSYNFANKKS